MTEQLADRFEAFELAPWKDDTDFDQSLVSYVALFPLRRPSQLRDAKVRKSLLAMSDGVTVRICRLHHSTHAHRTAAHSQRNKAFYIIGGWQPSIVRLASEGRFGGPVLDAGCGTGENALHLASLGLSVLGVDVAETALALAREKARKRGIEIELMEPCMCCASVTTVPILARIPSVKQS